MKKGFTLIELLVVVLVIGILASIALPQYTKAVAKARATEAVVIMNGFTNAIDRYVLANGLEDIDHTKLLQVLDVDLSKFTNHYIVSKESGCGTERCFVYIVQTENNKDFCLYASRGHSAQWEKTCYYQTAAGKGVCDGLTGSAGYTPAVGSGLPLSGWD